MNERDYLAERFEEHRTHLRASAYRMLGWLSEVDDAVQEAWLRLSRVDTTGIDNLGGCLTTVVAHVCLDMLRSPTERPQGCGEAPRGPSRWRSTTGHRCVSGERRVECHRAAAEFQQRTGHCHS